MKYNIHNQVEDFFAEQERLNQIDSGKKNLVEKGWNINYTNNTNTTNTKNSNYSKNDLLTTGTTSSSSGSLRESNVFAACPQGKDPLPGVKNMKIDLYNNADSDQLARGQHNYKINYQFIFYKGNEFNNFDPTTPLKCGSVNNRTDMKYFRAGIEKHSAHYKTCVATNQNIASYANDFKVEFQSMSKLFNKMGMGKGQTMPDFSSILVRTKKDYQIFLIVYDQVYAYTFDMLNLSEKQRKNNQIGTVVASGEKTTQKIKLPSARDIFKD